MDGKIYEGIEIFLTHKALPPTEYASDDCSIRGIFRESKPPFLMESFYNQKIMRLDKVKIKLRFSFFFWKIKIKNF